MHVVSQYVLDNIPLFFFNDTFYKTAVVAVIYIASLGVIIVVIGYVHTFQENQFISGRISEGLNTMFSGGVISAVFWVSSKYYCTMLVS